MGLSRAELWERLGVELLIVQPMLLDAYRREAEREWHGEDGWDQTSFYLSNFPGSDPACARAAIYSFLGLPNDKPIDVEGMRWMALGKAVEMEFLHKLAREGMLLTGDESVGEDQTRVRDPLVWASGAVDAVVLPPFWRKGHVVEVKAPGAEKIQKMRGDRDDVPYSHRKYVRQVKAYVALLHEQEFSPWVTVCRESWAIMREILPGVYQCPRHGGFGCEHETFQVAPPDDGTLIYASRDPERGRQLDTVEYHYGYDPEFLRAGRAQLAQWRAYFERGELPPHFRDGGKPQWSIEPCRFCNYKAVACKRDYDAKVTTIAESGGFEFARRVRPGYDYEAVRAAVFARWQVPDPLTTKEEVAA